MDLERFRENFADFNQIFFQNLNQNRLTDLGRKAYYWMLDPANCVHILRLESQIKVNHLRSFPSEAANLIEHDRKTQGVN